MQIMSAITVVYWMKLYFEVQTSYHDLNNSDISQDSLFMMIWALGNISIILSCQSVTSRLLYILYHLELNVEINALSKREIKKENQKQTSN